MREVPSTTAEVQPTTARTTTTTTSTTALTTAVTMTTVAAVSANLTGHDRSDTVEMPPAVTAFGSRCSFRTPRASAGASRESRIWSSGDE